MVIQLIIYIFNCGIMIASINNQNKFYLVQFVSSVIKMAVNKLFVSVCIATYKRPELLRQLLYSLSSQKINDNIKFEIIIVDNDSLKGAHAIVEDYKKIAVVNVQYLTQPIKNISLTRNKCVEYSTGEYILFIDDDEIAAPEWIQSMIDAIVKFNADAAFGRVLSHFKNETPDWIKRNPLFNRKAYPTGTEAYFTRTGNCIVKSYLLKNITGPFDPGYGTTGGEDTHLFMRLKKCGAKFVNCYEGWVSEYVPPERATTNYIIKRSYIRGNNFTRRFLELAGKKKFYRFIKSLFLSLIFVFISILLTIITFPNKYWRLYWATKIASNWGHISAVFGYYSKAYE